MLIHKASKTNFFLLFSFCFVFQRILTFFIFASYYWDRIVNQAICCFFEAFAASTSILIETSKQFYLLVLFCSFPTQQEWRNLKLFWLLISFVFFFSFLEKCACFCLKKFNTLREGVLFSSRKKQSTKKHQFVFGWSTTQISLKIVWVVGSSILKKAYSWHKVNWAKTLTF